MARKRKIPQFPDSYIGNEAFEYDNSKWMERNQKNTTLKIIQYLFDEELGPIDVNPENDLPVLILDLGCGTGFSSEVLKEHGFRVVGIDILGDMLSKANDKKKAAKFENIEFILADINNLPIKVNSIDHVVSISAYNFISHGKSSLRERKKIVNNTAKYLHEILKRNGRVIIEFYPESDEELKLFTESFTMNGFHGFMIKSNPTQKSGQTFLLLKRKG
ncbi:MAG: class I SAM-dependent methyltransferase [Promethearchaeota archaeon]|nr:MAG: class I SAM-dependent methyltransferase [Candidatus Lokiarchaeota archaeon]